MRGERERFRLRSPSSQASIVDLTPPRAVADSSPYSDANLVWCPLNELCCEDFGTVEAQRSSLRPEITVLIRELDGRERDKPLDNALMMRQCALMASIWGVEQMVPEASRSCCSAGVNGSAGLVKTLKAKKPSPRLPPGPWKLPLIGNIHQLAAVSLPHFTLRNLALNFGPLMHLQLGEVSTVVISSPEFAEEAMRKNDIIFASSYWRHLRKICVTELLSAQRVRSFRRVREEMVSNLIKTISSSQGSPINLSDQIFSLTYRITAAMAFASKCSEEEKFKFIITKVAELSTGLTLADFFPSIKAVEVISGIRPKLEKLHGEADRILENIISEHKARRVEGNGSGEDEKDIVDMLLDLQQHGNLDFPLSSNNIKSVILDMFAAGSETSSIAVEWAMSQLLKNPSLMEKATAEVRQVFNGNGYVDEAQFGELKFLKLVIKETLRLHNPVPLIPRECRENCKLGGYDIPANTKVLINSWAIARDSRYWSEPDNFNPERFLDSSLDYKGTDFQYIFRSAPEGGYVQA
ncbi:hypothetical protein CXB51_000479 [Gossypium anomalum]|uniref:Cytochrome P450 n=1 Tax=Gossypium anomalum TaxID=47600 RepID=A0A8J6DBT5_9ROSI|nr:hypothetical protein CXB51_000479 [Gossypium anomalum]